jgi:hypothetical protein
MIDHALTNTRYTRTHTHTNTPTPAYLLLGVQLLLLLLGGPRVQKHFPTRALLIERPHPHGGLAPARRLLYRLLYCGLHLSSRTRRTLER